MNSSSILPALRPLVLLALAALTSGCYEWQAAQGQLSIMAKRRPIASVSADPATPKSVREQLQQVTAIRDFASRELGLPDNGSYRSYVDLHREYVVWNVFAAPEFSVQPQEWCYPFVGCVAYRGYFREGRARELALEMRARGFDVAVGGVAAYSTLGHFDDPILSSMMGWNDVELAAIIFHELTHQMLYVKNDASFNEALATLVEQEGVRRWLLAQGRHDDLAQYLLQQQRYERVTQLLIATRGELATLYASKLDPAQMRAQKRAIFAAMQGKYDRLREEWGGRAPFADWFAGEINNAHLVSIATYESCVPGFARELATQGGALPAFYRRVRDIAGLPQAERDALVCDAPQQSNQ